MGHQTSCAVAPLDSASLRRPVCARGTSVAARRNRKRHVAAPEGTDEPPVRGGARSQTGCPIGPGILKLLLPRAMERSLPSKLKRRETKANSVVANDVHCRVLHNEAFHASM
ncbi:hypothetical protein MTO96_027241 [Rhipicephalus appendiculatus]